MSQTVDTSTIFLTHSQCVETILHVAKDVTPIITGEPGIGKTTMQRVLSSLLPDHQSIYINCAMLDVGDIAMMIPNHASKDLQPYTNSMLGLDNDRPKIIMLDEIGKLPKIMQPMITQLLLEREVCDRHLSDGTLVWGTTNNATDGLGDVLGSHSGNRMMVLNYMKPDADQTCAYFNDVGVTALTRAWIASNKSAFYSYLTCSKEDLDNNPYIFNPAKRQTSYVSQRSMFKADLTVVKSLNKRSPEVSQAMLSGTVGAAAAKSMITHFRNSKDMQPIKLVFADPRRCPIPEKDSALFTMLFQAIDDIKLQDELDAVCTYIDRKGNNIFSALFNTMALANKRIKHLAQHNPSIIKWLKEPGNYQLMV